MYIISIRFGESQSQIYYVRANENDWDEIYNPYFATEFAKMKEAKQWIVDSTSLDEYAKVVKSEKAKEAYDKWITSGTVRRTFKYLNPKLNTRYDSKIHTKIDVLNWKFLFSKCDDGDDRVKSYVHSSYPHLYQIFECLWDVETYYDRDTKTKSSSVKMAVKKSTKFETFQEELNLVLDKLTLKDKNGNLIISIMDYKCGDGGDFVHFEIRTDGTYAIADRWSDNRSGSLEEVFTYWQKKRYYGDSDDDDDDDGDNYYND